MKVIDLLNKIANSEEVPKKIMHKQAIYEFNEKVLCYENDFEFFPSIQEIELNDEVEIIEEDKEIEKLKNTINYYINYEDERLNEDISCICHHLISHIDKINELIDEVNKLKGEIENDRK